MEGEPRESSVKIKRYGEVTFRFGVRLPPLEDHDGRAWLPRDADGQGAQIDANIDGSDPPAVEFPAEPTAASGPDER